MVASSVRTASAGASSVTTVPSAAVSVKRTVEADVVISGSRAQPVTRTVAPVSAMEANWPIGEAAAAGSKV